MMKGVYNYILEDFDPATREITPRQYFSGGKQLVLRVDETLEIRKADSGLTLEQVNPQGQLFSAPTEVVVVKDKDPAMLTETQTAADRALIFSKMDAVNQDKIRNITDPEILGQLAETIRLMQPESVFVNSGTEADRAYITQMALEAGEEQALAMPGHTIHFDSPKEQGRIMERTFAIADQGVPTSSLGNKMDRAEAEPLIKQNLSNIMDGQTMIIGFYVRGPIGSEAAYPSLAISDSWHLFDQQNILYRIGAEEFQAQKERTGLFFTNIHGKGELDPLKGYVFMDRQNLVTYAWNLSYLGNVALIKKGHHRFAIDRSIYERPGVELSEHAFLTSVIRDGRPIWIAGAAPSGCGKTTTAMAGDRFIGDDLVQAVIRDGEVRGINPEKGIFGILENLTAETDPGFYERLRNPGSRIIWTNVGLHEGVPYWEGSGEELPAEAINHKGRWARNSGQPISHPNSRATIASDQLSNYDQEAANDPNGVPISVFTYAGRDPDTVPTVVVALTPEEGVTFGADIVSAATATEQGATGIKRAPWANASFVMGALGDYMNAHFKFMTNPEIAEENRPIIAALNYFLTHEARNGSGRGLIGEIRDTKVWLTWVAKFANGEVEGIKTAFGIIPSYGELVDIFAEILPDKNYTRDVYDMQFSLYVDKLIQRIDYQVEAWGKDQNVPQRYFEIQAVKRARLKAVQDMYGSVVTPEQSAQFAAEHWDTMIASVEQSAQSDPAMLGDEVVQAAAQEAAQNQVGGVDMHSRWLQMERIGSWRDIIYPIDLNIEALQNINIRTVVPMIFDLTPLPNIYPLLGLDEREQQLAQSVR